MQNSVYVATHMDKVNEVLETQSPFLKEELIKEFIHECYESFKNELQNEIECAEDDVRDEGYHEGYDEAKHELEDKYETQIFELQMQLNKMRQMKHQYRKRTLKIGEM